MSLSRHDVRIAARSFAKQPGFAIVAVLSLALAIALNTTMYSVIDAMVHPALDIRDADQVARLRIWGDFRGTVDPATRAALFRDGARAYSATTFSTGFGRSVAIEYGRRYLQTGIAVVAPNYFTVLGVRPVSGRAFVDEDFTASTAPIMISERIAGSLFPDGKSPVGAIVDVDGEPHPVIGVVRRASQLPGSYDDIFMLPPSTTPLSSIPTNIVRLRPGLSLAQAEHDLVTLSTRLALLAREDPKYTRFQLVAVNVSQFQFKRFHYALIAAVIAVLLVACANLANLQLARGIRRSRELALRAALGATRRDIINQLLLESAMLAGVGLTLGLLLTFWGNHLLSSRIPPSVAEYVIAPQTSWRVFAFAVFACVLCVLLIGLLPAIRVSRVDPNELLKSGAGTGANKKNRRQYGIMVAAEIGLSLALLSGAALVIRSALYYQEIHYPYDLKPLSSAMMVDGVAANTAIHYADFENSIVDRLRTVPDVADAAISFFRSVIDDATTVADQGGDKREVPTPGYGYEVTSPSYFRTMQIPIDAGRDFSEGVASEGELIVDAPTAKYLWPNGHAIGGLVKLGSDSSHAPWVGVVGIVKSTDEADRRYNGVVEIPKHASRLGRIFYRPAERDSFATTASWGLVFDVVVRAKTDPARMPITLRRVFAKAAPIRIVRASSMEESLGLLQLRQSHDFVAATFTSFTLLALALAALGIFGIVSYSVAERKRELGVRIALGANARNVLDAVLREGNAIALAGVAIGLFFTKETAGWLAAFIFEDDQYDAPLFAAMAAVLFVVVVVAALLPAWRATRIDPVESLRSE